MSTKHDTDWQVCSKPGCEQKPTRRVDITYRKGVGNGPLVTVSKIIPFCGRHAPEHSVPLER